MGGEPSSSTPPLPTITTGGRPPPAKVSAWKRCMWPASSSFTEAGSSPPKAPSRAAWSVWLTQPYRSSSVHPVVLSASKPVTPQVGRWETSQTVPRSGASSESRRNCSS